MANNYLQFSLHVPLKIKAKLRWVAKTLAAITRLFDSPGEIDEKRARALGPLGKRIIDERWDYLDFQWSLEPAHDDAHVGALWIYADESGNPDQVAVVLEEYLKLFAPTGVITFTWACTCSKMRVDEFSGGAAVVTAGGTKMLDAQSWAEDLAAKFVSTAPETSP